MQRDEMQKRRRDVMVACPFILPGHLLLGVVGFCDMTALLPLHEQYKHTKRKFILKNRDGTYKFA